MDRHSWTLEVDQVPSTCPGTPFFLQTSRSSRIETIYRNEDLLGEHCLPKGVCAIAGPTFVWIKLISLSIHFDPVLIGRSYSPPQFRHL